MDLQKLILHQNIRDVCHHSLLSETSHSAVVVGAFLQFHAHYDDIIQQLEAESCSLMGFGGLVNHGLNQRVIELFIISNGIEAFCMGIISLGNNGYGVFLGLWLAMIGLP